MPKVKRIDKTMDKPEYDTDLFTIEKEYFLMWIEVNKDKDLSEIADKLKNSCFNSQSSL